MTTKTHYPGLDALRGIAVILVVLYHYVPFFRIGWIGVDLFFVLSGFLITGNLLRGREQKDYFKNFYIRRVLRIFPLYYLALVVFYTSAPYVFSNQKVGSTYCYYIANQAYFWTFTQNWLFIRKGMPTEPYLSHFWSLAIEEQFYLFWPFLVFLCRNLTALKIVLSAFFLLALGLRLCLYFQGVSQIDSYYCNLFTRLDALSAGGFLAVWLFEKKQIPRYFHFFCFVLLLTLILYSAFCAGLNNDSALSRTLGYSVYAAFFASCCSLALTENAVLARFLFLHFLGKISYGIYVYHLPILLLFYYFFAEKMRSALGNDTATFFLALCSAGITLLASIISYYTIESPFLKLKEKFAGSPK